MTAPNTVFPPAAMAAATHHLEAFALSNFGVQLVVLTSGDGFEIAAYPQANPATPRIAAMTSSMQALAAAMARESNLERNRSVILEADGGTILVLDLDESLPRTSLAVVASGKELLGKLLWASRNLCKVLEKTLAP